MKKLMLHELLNDPLYFPFQLIRGQKISYLRISEDTFIKSPFLDTRILQGGDRKFLYANSMEVANNLKEVKVESKKRLIHIFHISHVGSTFVAKLLESSNDTKVLREPNILRDLTREYSEMNQFSSEYKKSELDLLLNGILKSFLSGDRSKVILKHTSGNLSLPIACKTIDNIGQKEILLFTDLESFLSHSIASDGLRSDAETNAKTRLRYFNDICLSNHLNLSNLKLIEKVSLIWMVEFSRMLSRKISNADALLINFDSDFQEKNKEETIRKIVQLIDDDISDIDRIMSRRDWNINPKNGKEFSFRDREDAIMKNYLSSKIEINETVNWVEGICKQEPYLMPLINYIRN
ncbi:hypothetical protein N9H97_00815 [Gammaproteobacteria bacterium]|nr:hypothetical protein [Gammaproteobacteria bacterium]